MAQILLVAPDERLAQLCQLVGERHHISVKEVASVEQVSQVAERHSLIFLPLALAGLTGLAALRLQLPTLEVVALAHSGKVEEAVEAIREGALDYLALPWRKWNAQYAPGDCASTTKVKPLTFPRSSP
jgi:DNA-binding NtrC family response regulator